MERVSCVFVRDSESSVVAHVLKTILDEDFDYFFVRRAFSFAKQLCVMRRLMTRFLFQTQALDCYILRREKGGGVLVYYIKGMEVERAWKATLIDENLNRDEDCEVSVSFKRLTLSVEGRKTLITLPIDSIDAVITSTALLTHFRGHEGGMCSLLVLRPKDQSWGDLALYLDGEEESAPLADEIDNAIWQLRHLRIERTNGEVKPLLIRYRLDIPLDDGLIKGRILGDGTQSPLVLRSGRYSSDGEVVKSAQLIPFPHSRLDFLGLHKNKSVMHRLSGSGDTSIQLTTDKVRLVGNSSGIAAGYVSAPTPLCFEDARNLLARDEVVSSCVLIIGNRNVYVTESTGGLIMRVGVETMESVVILSPSAPDELPIMRIRFLSPNEGETPSFVLIETKFAMDASHRLKSCAGSRLSTSANRETSVVSKSSSEEPVCASDSSIKGRESSPSVKFVVESHSIGVQCSLVSSSSSIGGDPQRETESTSELCKILSDNRLDHGSAATMTLMSSKIHELEETVHHGQITIQLLQQRCEQLALNVPSSVKNVAPTRRVRGSTMMKKAEEPPDQTASLKKEVELLRHYTSFLEIVLKEESQKTQEDGLFVNKLAEFQKLTDVEKLRLQLVESAKTEECLRRKISSLRTESCAFSASVKRTLQEVSQHATDSVHNFVKNYETSGRDRGAVNSIWNQVVKRIGDADGRMYDEVKRQTSLLQQQNATLVTELENRERQLDEIGSRLSTRGTTTDIAHQPHTARLIDRENDLQRSVLSLEGEVKRLQAAREALLQSGCGDEESLRQQVAVLSKLSAFESQITHVATLEVMLLDFEELKLRKIELERTIKKLTADNRKFAGKNADQDKVQSELLRRVSIAEKNETEMAELVSKMEAKVQKLTTEHADVVKALKKELRSSHDTGKESVMKPSCSDGDFAHGADIPSINRYQHTTEASENRSHVSSFPPTPRSVVVSPRQHSPPSHASFLSDQQQYQSRNQPHTAAGARLEESYTPRSIQSPMPHPTHQPVAYRQTTSVSDIDEKLEQQRILFETKLQEALSSLSGAPSHHYDSPTHQKDEMNMGVVRDFQLTQNHNRRQDTPRSGQGAYKRSRPRTSKSPSTAALRGVSAERPRMIFH